MTDIDTTHAYAIEGGWLPGACLSVWACEPLPDVRPPFEPAPWPRPTVLIDGWATL